MGQKSSSQNTMNLTGSILPRLRDRPIILVGLMGAGKSAIGRKLAQALQLPFADSDSEIEKAADMPVADIFQAYGEPEFRRLEASVIKRLIGEGGRVIATGGGAFMDPDTRDAIKATGISVWLYADIDLLMARVSRKTTRPLLQNPNPRGVMQDLMDKRYPVYAAADITVASEDVSKDAMVLNVLKALKQHLSKETA
ncbi:MAG: shikimate kinase [Pseudomonadota bacterium]